MEDISIGLIAAFAGLIALSQALVKLAEKGMELGTKKYRNGGGNRREHFRDGDTSLFGGAAMKGCPFERSDRDNLLRMSDSMGRMEHTMSDTLKETTASKTLLEELRDGQKARLERIGEK